MNNGFSKEAEVVITFCLKKKVMEIKVKKFVNEFPNRNWSSSSLNKLLTKLR